MRWGLVELHVDLEGVVAPSQTDAVLAGIRRDTSRPAAVRAALERAKQLGCGFIELPGWTLVEKRSPSWLIDLSSGVTLVAECLHLGLGDQVAGGRAKGTSNVRWEQYATGAKTSANAAVPASPIWESYVLHDGQVLIGPARQHTAASGDPWDGDELSECGISLVRDLQVSGRRGRRWTIQGAGQAMLLLCGEANIIGGGGPVACRNHAAVAAAGLTEERLATVRVIANPASASQESSTSSSTVPDHRDRHYLECVEGGSKRFWEIIIDGSRHTVRFGRIGSDGQSRTKSFADYTAARSDAERLIREKLAKGYVEHR
jgi:predicted DNA-binding WGR domain protein